MWIFLTILAVLLFLLCMPLTAEIAYREELSLRVQYLFLNIGILPQEKKEDKPKKEKKSKKKQEQEANGEEGKKKKAKKKMTLDSLLQLLELAKLALSSVGHPLGWFLRSIYYRDVWLHILVAKEDAHQTALRYGQIQAIIHTVFTLLRNCLDIKTTDVQIQADFIGEKELFQGGAKIKLRPINVFILLFWFIGRFIKGFVQNKWLEHKTKKQCEKQTENK